MATYWVFNLFCLELTVHDLNGYRHHSGSPGTDSFTPVLRGVVVDDHPTGRTEEPTHLNDSWPDVFTAGAGDYHFFFFRLALIFTAIARASRRSMMRTDF